MTRLSLLSLTTLFFAGSAVADTPTESITLGYTEIEYNYARDGVPQDSFSINFAKIETSPSANAAEEVTLGYTEVEFSAAGRKDRAGCGVVDLLLQGRSAAAADDEHSDWVILQGHGTAAADSHSHWIELASVSLQPEDCDPTFGSFVRFTTDGEILTLGREGLMSIDFSDAVFGDGEMVVVLADGGQPTPALGLTF